MKRSSLISWVDLTAFISFFTLMATGFVLKFQLPPGSGRIIKEQMGRGTLGREISLLWGLTRHQWGEIHFWIAIVMITAMVLHLAIHWKWIVVSIKGKAPAESRIRVAIGILGLLALLALGISMLFAPKDSATRAELLERSGINPEDVLTGGGGGHGAGRQADH
ncbi:MAG: DUF4405 domain-containing protein [Verrucomicrobia bacterium]|nr:DUF4405 domain-containing protein [Verrucomicrobiota bacterium]